MVAHRDLTGADLHEPKGVATASIDTIYVADGSGSGSWKKVEATSLSGTSIKNLNKFHVSGYFQNMNTASTSIYIPVRADTRLLQVYVTQQSNNSANITLSFFDNLNNSMGEGLVLISAGSAAGNTYTFAPTAASVFTADTFLRVTTSGGGTACPGILDFEFEYT